jgi:hypothetical protein
MLIYIHVYILYIFQVLSEDFALGSLNTNYEMKAVDHRRMLNMFKRWIISTDESVHRNSY